MPSLAVIGAQWGDEGKAKVIDLIAENADIIARFQGGPNAGHTVRVNGSQFIFHLVPTGLLHPGKVGVIGNGVVVSLPRMFSEIDTLISKGVDVEGRLLMSGRAHLILPYHIELERALEAARGDQKIGTTLRGVGTTYTSKAMRMGVHACDLLDEQVFLEKVEMNLRLYEQFGVLRGNMKEYLNSVASEVLPLIPKVEPMIADTGRYLRQALATGKRVMFEGAQGTMLDLDHGTYPFVTSSSPTSGGVCTGLGVPPTAVDQILGITKAYVTRVGEGPFPTELTDEVGERIRTCGHEFGSTTGRPRRCGWLDLVALKYAIELNGFTSLALTKLDILDSFEQVSVCTGYRYRGELLTEYPQESWILTECTPEYETFPGWRSSTTGSRTFEALPLRAREFIQWISEFLDTPISLLSIGAERGKTLLPRESSLAANGWIPESLAATVSEP